MLRLTRGLLPLAAVLAVAAAGSKAQAGTTNTITLHLVNLTVTDPTTQASYPTISAAVAAADAGETVRVAAGTYNESVKVNKPLALQGAQLNTPATNGRPTNGQESVVDGGASSSFFLEADNISVNGFSFTGSESAALEISGNRTGLQILNNVISGNAAGIVGSIQGDTQSVIRGNLLSANNNSSGFGGGILAFGGFSNTVLERNKFTGHDRSAAFFLGGTQLTLTNNEFRAESSVAFSFTEGTTITDNLFVNGVAPSGGNEGDFSAQIALLIGNTDVTITGNRFLDNAGTGVFLLNGSSKGGGKSASRQLLADFAKTNVRGKSQLNSDVHVNGNDFIGNGSAIEAQPNSHEGTVDGELNYYGDDSGPQAKGNAKGTGDAVIGDVDYIPWLRRSITDTGGPARDISNRLLIYKGLPFTQPRRPGYYATITVINNGRTTLRGPFAVVISGITGGARVVDVSGFTSLIQPRNSAFVNLAGGDLAPGEIVLATVRFTGRTRDFRYKVRVFSGEPDDNVPTKKL